MYTVSFSPVCPRGALSLVLYLDSIQNSSSVPTITSVMLHLVYPKDGTINWPLEHAPCKRYLFIQHILIDHQLYTMCNWARLWEYNNKKSQKKRALASCNF